MSTEIHLGGFISPSHAGPVPFSKEFDRIRHTAADRPHTDSLPTVPDPAADHCNDELLKRRQDIDEKHRRIRSFLDATGHDGVVLGRADSVAWFTSGGDLRQDLSSEFSSIILYINRVSRAVIADNVESARVFEEELAGLGFQLKERPWYEDPGRILAELCHNKKVATDLGGNGLGPFSRREGDVLLNLRRRLTPFERQRMRELGRTLALAVEATCRNFSKGENEAAIAGHLAHRLMREGVVPVDLRVASDDRLARYRQPTFKSNPILKRATIAVTGRRWGLCASLTRTVSFGPVEPEFQSLHTLSAMVAATCFFFSRPGESVSEVFRRAKRIYEKFNHPHEWTLDYQGSLVGYSPREAMLLPESDLILEADMPICWNPSVGPTRSEDTVVVDNRGYEVVTSAQNWPAVEVAVKGFIISRPGILER
ncbi:MAG: peptidase M24 [Planctomycetes bacterium SCN 63-9]|mgnify:CR=1 FL=1|nr:MAG: peptidase M24 [Planctomycetes bacterium SCN 63-9]